MAQEYVTTDNYHIGMEVVRGRDWEWYDEDNFPGNIGVITKYKCRSGGDEWVYVRWKGNNKMKSYRIGPKSFDLAIHNGEEIYELW